MRRPALVALTLTVIWTPPFSTEARAAEVAAGGDDGAPVVEIDPAAGTPRSAPVPAGALPLPAPVPAPERRWYGWQILFADAMAIAGAFVLSEEALLSGYLVSGPAVHTLHGRPAMGAVSLGLRLVLPVVGGLIGYSTASCTEEEWLCGLGHLGIGMLAGAGTAMVIDAVNAFTNEVSPPAAERSKPRSFAIAPRLAANPSSIAFGVGGTF